MKTISLLFLFGFSLTVQPNSSANELFVMLSSSDQETQMFAMVLATRAAEQGKAVRILLCGEAGRMAIRGLPSDKFGPSDRSPHELLYNLKSNGARVEVCAIFIPNRDFIRSDLEDGITIANPDDVASYMMRPEVKLLTF